MPSREFASVLATFLVATSVIWLALFLVGKATLVLVGHETYGDRLSPVVGMATVSFSGGVASTIGIPMRIWSIGLVAFASIFLVVRKREIRGIFPQAETTTMYGFAVIAVLAFYAPALNRFGLNLFSLGNQDIMGYALDVKHLLRKGYWQVGEIQNYDAGWRSQWDWAGTKSLASFGTAVSGGDVLNSMIPLMAVMLVQCILSAAELVGAQLKSVTMRVLAPTAVIGAILSPLGGHVYGNYLLGQTVALTFAISILAVITNGQTDGSHAVFILLVSGMAICWSAGAFLIGGVAGVGLVLSAITRLSSFRETLTNIGRKLWDAMPLLWLPLLVGFSAMIWAVRMGFIYTASTAGWPLPTSSLFDLVGFTSDVFRASSRTEHLLGAITALTIVFGISFTAVRSRRTSNRQRILVLTSLIAVLGVGWIHYGSTTYSFWKLESLLWPLIFLSVLEQIVARSSSARVTAVIGTMFCVLSVHSVYSSSHLWRTSAYTLGIDPAILSLRNDPVLNSINGVQVDLGGGWQEMSAMAVLHNPVVRSLNDTFFAKLPATDLPRLVSPDHVSLEGDHVTTLSNGFLLIDQHGTLP